MSKVISFLNIKGGVAKTTSCVNIATELGRLGKKVLIIDLDPQSNATKYLNMYDSRIRGSYELFSGEDVSVNGTKYDGVWMIPANIRLIASESEILKDNERVKETILKEWLSNKPEDIFDYILIDCPPSLGMISINALAASDHVLVPLKIDKFSLDGFEYLNDSVNSVKEQFNKKLKLLGIVITMDRATKINREIKEELRRELGSLIFNQTIRENIDVVKSTFESTPLIYFNNRANASKDYKALVDELLCRLI
jgi:chromosome partitioning protein